MRNVENKTSWHLEFKIL